MKKYPKYIIFFFIINGFGQQGVSVVKSTITTNGSSTAFLQSSNGGYQVQQSIGQMGIVGLATLSKTAVQQGFLNYVLTIDNDTPEVTQSTIDFTAYPNPVGDELTISFTSLPSGPVTVNFFELNGRNIDSKTFEANQTILVETFRLKVATYIMQIEVGDSKWARKIIKRSS